MKLDDISTKGNASVVAASTETWQQRLEILESSLMERLNLVLQLQQDLMASAASSRRPTVTEGEASAATDIVQEFSTRKAAAAYAHKAESETDGNQIGMDRMESASTAATRLEPGIEPVARHRNWTFTYDDYGKPSRGLERHPSVLQKRFSRFVYSVTTSARSYATLRI